MFIRQAYISGLGVFLPNDPVDNESIERVLGHVNRASERVKTRVLKSNGIETRHYAIDPVSRAQTHTNVEMTVAAIAAMCDDAGFAETELECLACGTSSPDQLIPAHANMVHAELAAPTCEVVTMSGVCCAGMGALKYAFMNVATGLVDNAVATGSELASPSLRSSHFESELEIKEADLDQRPIIAFENDFLRWMLSDAAGALLVTPYRLEEASSLRIDWIDSISFANESDVCMYYGLRKLSNGGRKYFRNIFDSEELIRDGYLSLAQDIKVLQDRLPVLMTRAVERSIRRNGLKSDEVDWLLPHYSSALFRQPLYEGLRELNCEIPWSRWFTNLPSKGNAGSASIYVIIEEFVKSGRAKLGDRILCIVPESARMAFSLMHLTVV